MQTKVSASIPINAKNRKIGPNRIEFTVITLNLYRNLDYQAEQKLWLLRIIAEFGPNQSETC